MTDTRQAPTAGAPAYNDADDADELPPTATPNLGEDQQLFFMNGDDLSYENFAMYRKYGYHPIILGDILPKPGTCESDTSKAPRYRVMLKLGFGAFATVWLARDLLEGRYVALKVCCGVDKPKFSRETNILYHIQQTAKTQPGYSNILTLYEAFIISGPNGFHECLVTEVLAPLEGLGINKAWPRQEVVQQISSAVYMLHSQGIAHGDLHQENFGVAVPGLQDVFEEDIMDHYLGDQEVIPVIPRDPTFPRETVPAYISPSAYFGAFLSQQGRYPEPLSATVKLFDFGRAFFTDRPPRYLPGGAACPIRPPEVLVYDITGGRAGSVWSKEGDIWSLGCTMYPRILVDENGFGDFYRPLAKALHVGGPPPRDWLDHLDCERLCSTTSSRIRGAPASFSSADHLLAWLSEEAAKSWTERKEYHGDTQGQGLISLVQGMVKTEPGARVDIAGMLAHPFLCRDL